MNKFIWISGFAIFLAAIFLIPNTQNTTMAYSCSSSSSTHNTNSQSGVSGSSGGCSSSSSATSTPGPNGSIQFTASGPTGTPGLFLSFCTTSCSATAPGQTAAGASAAKSNPSSFSGNFPVSPGLVTGTGTLTGSPIGVQLTLSTSAGGSQSSCSSSSANYSFNWLDKCVTTRQLSLTFFCFINQ